ncbi:MAG: asparagine synthase (glutamine-hydrolyzing) [Planctomycetota bacterium]
MCGIAGGCWTGQGEPLSEAILRRMTDAIRHRGPDDEGQYHSTTADIGSTNGNRSGGAALGHRRLSIIDLSGGHQPLSNEDGSVWIAFNGEVYNYRELHPRLEALGHRFRTASDTECIVHAYEQWGHDCLQHLRGMFAFAIWDDRRRRLFLARDRMGQKPLVYRVADHRLTFASELKSLLQVPGAPRDINHEAVADFVTLQYVPHPKTMLRGYHKLPPAHWAEFDAATGDLIVRRYWEAPYARSRESRVESQEPDVKTVRGDSVESIDDSLTLDPRPSTLDSWKSLLRERLTEAVRLRMRSDVPFGAFLSGGVDSTIITGLMQQQIEHKVQTFSIGFSVKQFDERSYAREAAAKLGTDHHEFVVDPSAVEMLPKLVEHYDEPFADSSAIPTMYLSRLTRQHVTVALSGDGGDELFAGYDRYLAVDFAAKIDRWPWVLRAIMANPIWQRLPAPVGQKSLLRRIKRFLGAFGQRPERRYANWMSIFDDARRPALLSRDFATSLGEYDGASFLLDAYSRCSETDFVQRTTCVDVETYLPCDILTKVDIASMAYGLEARSPFMDHRVVELAAQIPRPLKLHHRRGKRILVETFADLLPESIQTRPKMGFGVPLDHWFRGELREMLCDTLLDPRSLQRGYFDPAAVRRLIDEHASAQWDHSARLWLLLVFELWHRRFIDVAISPSAST